MLRIRLEMRGGRAKRDGFADCHQGSRLASLDSPHPTRLRRATFPRKGGRSGSSAWLTQTTSADKAQTMTNSTRRTYPEFDGKVVVVTGGSAGIGRAIACSLCG